MQPHEGRQVCRAKALESKKHPTAGWKKNPNKICSSGAFWIRVPSAPHILPTPSVLCEVLQSTVKRDVQHCFLSGCSTSARREQERCGSYGLRLMRGGGEHALATKTIGPSSPSLLAPCAGPLSYATVGRANMDQKVQFGTWMHQALEECPSHLACAGGGGFT
jgi:hypothetical protein